MQHKDAPPASNTGRNADVVIAVVVVGAALYWLSDIITPFALAFFLLIMIDGLEDKISQKAPRLPGWRPWPSPSAQSCWGSGCRFTSWRPTSRASRRPDQLVGRRATPMRAG
jgi:hypothetical protein